VERFLGSSTPHQEVLTPLQRQAVSPHDPDQRLRTSQSMPLGHVGAREWAPRAARDVPGRVLGPQIRRLQRHSPTAVKAAVTAIAAAPQTAVTRAPRWTCRPGRLSQQLVLVGSSGLSRATRRAWYLGWTPAMKCQAVICLWLAATPPLGHDLEPSTPGLHPLGSRLAVACQSAASVCSYGYRTTSPASP
jgi:hypothetical protein